MVKRSPPLVVCGSCHAPAMPRSPNLLPVLAVAWLGACGGSPRAVPAAPTPTPAAAPATDPASITVQRSDFTVDAAAGISLSVRAVIPAPATRVPVLLIHGAGGGGVASFDVPVPGYSLAEDLARAGHPTYAMDVRGWGGSTRPPALSVDPTGAPPAVLSAEAVSDVAAVVAALRARHSGARVALVGWATGGHWAGMYAAAHPDAVARLVMLNALYGVAAPWSLQTSMEDRPGSLAPLGAYRRRNGSGLVSRWNVSIPIANRDAWRDPRVMQAYIDAAITSDPEAERTHPPAVRVPSGPLHDSYLLATGTKMWSAAQLRCPVLVIRGALDFWSRPEDVQALRADLPPGVSFQSLEIPDAIHFVHLDRPERGRAALVTALQRFLSGS